MKVVSYICSIKSNIHMDIEYIIEILEESILEKDWEIVSEALEYIKGCKESPQFSDSESEE